MSKKMKLIPEFRFPEFVNDEEWTKTTVEKLIQRNILFPPKDGNHGNIHPKSSDYVKSGIPFIMASDLKNGKVDFSKCACLKKEQADSLQKGFAKSGDVLLTHKGTVGEVAMLTELEFPYIMLTPQVTYYRIKDKSELVNEFLAAFFNSDFFQRNLLNVSGGGTRAYVGITKQQLFEVHHPKKVEEQQKIASCLSSLDQLIAAHNDKLETLKDHKKGLMQNLFPQKGQKVPNYRFPEFEKDGEWSEEKLEDVASFSKGKGISKSDIAENGRVPCIRYGELYTHYNETISFVHSYTNLDPKVLVLSEANDVIIPASGETQIDIATASCVLEENIALGSDLNIIKTNINGVFLSYYLNNAKKMDIAQIAQGISVVHLYANQLKTLVLNIPKPKEQEKIAFCLSALDELITVQSEKIEQLQQHKKGLTQRLFPNTGEIR